MNDEIIKRVASLFTYIQELNKLKQKTILDVNDYRWKLWCSELPDDGENIQLFYQDRIGSDAPETASDRDNILLSVHKEEFESCPVPPDSIRGWLKDGWNDYKMEAEYQDEKTDAGSAGRIISFAEKTDRVQAFDEWMKLRETWAENQKRIAGNRAIFDRLYSEYFALKRDGESEEVIVANGVLRDAMNPGINHPVLTRRVKFDFDAANNTMFIRDTEAVPELYTDVMKVLDDVNLQEINSLQDKLVEDDYHPLDRNDTPGFLKLLIRQLSSKSIYSEDGVPAGWEQNNRFLLYDAPCFMIRKRQDGTVRAIEKINEAIADGVDIPKTLIDLVSGGRVDVPVDDREYSIEEQLAMVGGESPEVLLSKEANREQLEIAQRIENYNAVLVQGPPGTGKTHTIANLLGHFIAQGKSVLVTSHTTKALDVLKDKIAPGLQNLCVSLLDDSNKDMEASVEGITSFMSQNSSNSLRRSMEELGEVRKGIIANLADVRKKIFQIIQTECESIVYQGESLTPTEAARFVSQNTHLDYIPGTVKANSVLPLTFDELVDLYRSNEIISDADADEMSLHLPSPQELKSVEDFKDLCQRLSELESRVRMVNEGGLVRVELASDRQVIDFRAFGRGFSIRYPSLQAVEALRDFCNGYGEITAWQQAVVIDGKAGGGYRRRWQNLIQQIESAAQIGAELADKGLGMEVAFAEGIFLEDLLEPLKKVKGFYDEGGLPFMFSVFHKKCDEALKAVRVGGRVPASGRDCELAVLHIELRRVRKACSNSWNELLVPHGVPPFMELGPEPERAAEKYVHSINAYLDWIHVDNQKLAMLLHEVGFPENIVCGIAEFDPEPEALTKKLKAIHGMIPVCCEACLDILNLLGYKEQLDQLAQIVMKDSRINSGILQDMSRGITARDPERYSEALGRLTAVYDKYHVLAERNEYLKRLAPYAPDWAEAIRRHEGIHGEAMVRSDIMDAWKWRQLSMMIDDIASKPLSEYQAESRRLSKAYRDTTAEYAEKSGWYQLLLKTEADLDLQQALQGWRVMVKKIGKGTGKRAPKFKAEARKLMVKCQKAVPAWIMPIYKAMENLNPAENVFDIVIVDEASQSDISSLAILYMGRKLIIVGDDKQVSPMAVGIDADKMDNLRKMYLSEDIPNYMMYDAQTSIYDIAMTTYHPLMLREHFRCVPEIIGYSNWLSYEGKILPLRSAASSNLLPAVVNHRIDGGMRDGKRKINHPEAEAILALMKACMEQPEYAGKTFGVISLLGAEQARLIEKLINQDEDISAKEIEERRILCGDSSNFQGDERDVIFLSMVDCPANPGEPLSLQGFGIQDSTRKRYNVAASRARDQLWVVNSLDHNVNLKAGDIRKGLIEYALNPEAVDIQKVAAASQADSEFEMQVVMALRGRGYHIVQQWEVGAYRIDMVAVCGDKKIAIECDGDRYHSSPSQVRNDMERQTILERIGWTFIRIRGSEYFRDPGRTIDRVTAELEAFGIRPEVSGEMQLDDARNTELLERVRHRAELILHPEGEEQVYIDYFMSGENSAGY